MKSIFSPFISIALISLLTACNCLKSSGPVVEKSLSLDAFTSINLSNSAKVILSQGKEQSVKVKAPQDVIDQLNTKISGDEWDIEFNECIDYNSEMLIYITLAKIEELQIQGSGSIESEGELKTEDLEIDIQGSGNIKLNLVAESVDVDIQGSGSVYLSGKSTEIEVDVQGSGDLKASQLESSEADVSIQGSGDAEVNVSQRLDVSIQGSGDVMYSGNPEDIKISNQGSGEVKNAK